MNFREHTTTFYLCVNCGTPLEDTVFCDDTCQHAAEVRSALASSPTTLWRVTYRDRTGRKLVTEVLALTRSLSVSVAYDRIVQSRGIDTWLMFVSVTRA